MHTRPTVTDSVNPTSDTTTAAMVAPISGMRSKMATNSASASANGIPTMLRKMYDVRPAMNATDSAPLTKPPIRLMTSSLSSVTRSRRLAGHEAVGLAFHARQRSEEVQRHDEQRERAEHRVEHHPAHSDDAAEHPLAQVTLGDVVLGALDDAVVVVELADRGVPAQVGEVVGQLLDERVALLDHRREEGEAEADEGADDPEEHDRDRDTRGAGRGR